MGSWSYVYFDVFDTDQIYVATLDEISATPKATLTSISEFLGINTDFWKSYDFFKNIRVAGGTPRNQLANRLIKSDVARAIGRFLIPKFLRKPITDNILIKKGKKEPIPVDAKRIIWNYCENEIELLEDIVVRKFPELWKTHPDKSNTD